MYIYSKPNFVKDSNINVILLLVGSLNTLSHKNIRLEVDKP